jgi:hypothetical protein
VVNYFHLILTLSAHERRVRILKRKEKMEMNSEKIRRRKRGGEEGHEEESRKNGEERRIGI